MKFFILICVNTTAAIIAVITAAMVAPISTPYTILYRFEIIFRASFSLGACVSSIA
jgi:hypothetical protein